MALATFRSSGDLNADRRYAYALDLLAEGDPKAAADLLVQTLELVPDWSVGWLQLGLAHDAGGNHAAAAAAFARAAALQPDDRLGARLHLARLGAIATPASPPASYVRDLFDDYAGRFDRALVDGLHYRAPQLIVAALLATRAPARFRYGLDLGCGTGLMAAELRPMVDRLKGIDLSAGMTAVAASKGLYEELVVGDIVEAMRTTPSETYDLVTAADVFCYLGDLGNVIAEAARVLTPRGLLAFSVEAASESDAGQGFAIAESLRFRHSSGYIAAHLGAEGLEANLIVQDVLRSDRGQAVAGLIVVAEKPQVVQV
jgi:predicted TPR repeat methyltransferase